MQEFERIEFVKEENGNKLYINGKESELKDCTSITIKSIPGGYFEVSTESKVELLCNGPLVTREPVDRNAITPLSVIVGD